MTEDEKKRMIGQTIVAIKEEETRVLMRLADGSIVIIKATYEGYIESERIAI